MCRGAEDLQRSSARKMPGCVEGVVDRGVGGEKPLSRGLRPESHLLSFAFSDRKVAVFGAVIFPQTARVMEVLKLQLSQRGAIGTEPIRNDRRGLNRLISQQPPQQLQCRLGVSIPLHNKVEDLALIIHGAPQEHASPADLTNHFVEAPPRGGGRPAPLQPPGDLGTELDRPAPNGFIAYIDPACGKQFFDIPETERETEIQPNGMKDHRGRKSVSFERESLHNALSHKGFQPAKWRPFSVRLTAPGSPTSTNSPPRP